MCLVCNKTKTHVMHEGQGVAEPDDQQEDPAFAQEATQQAAQVEIGQVGQPDGCGPIMSLPMPDRYFRIESNGTTIQFEMAIPEPADKCEILLAAVEFLNRVSPKEPKPQNEADQPDKGKSRARR